MMKVLQWLAMGLALITAPNLAESAPAKADLPQESGVHLARMTLGFTYYNRVGATLGEHDTDVEACVGQAASTRSFDEVINNGASMGLAGAIIGGVMQNAYWHGTVGAGLENCMVVRGWRVVRLADADGQALAALQQADLREKLDAWIGAESPPGEVVRLWANDAANAAIPRFAIRPAHTNDGQLSLKAATGKILPDVEKPAPPPAAKVTLDKTWARKPLKPAEIGQARPDAGVLIARIAGVSGRNGNGVWFGRPGPDPLTTAASVDHAPDVAGFFVGTLFAKEEGNFLILQVPPGRWRMSGLGVAPILNLCLGSPSLEVKAGEVIYLGSFDFSASALGPDLELAPVRTLLAGLPSAGTVKPASYVNGSTALCGDPGMYAFEVPGAPFERGYAFGGARAAVVAGAN